MFVATLIFLALIVWLSDELRFLIPWRSLIIHHYLGAIVTYCALLFANIFGLAIWMERKFFLRDTGSKLKHFDQEIHSGRNELSAEITDQLSVIKTPSWWKITRLRAVAPPAFSLPVPFN